MVCDKCNGVCCKSFVLFVTAHDAARVAKALQVDPLSFLDAYPAKVDSRFPTFKIDGKDYLLGLDSKHGVMEECVFLMALNTTYRCGIHKHRPMVCRTYPFRLNNGELDFVEEMVCPKQWWPEGKERMGYIKNIEQFAKELEEYREITERWNKKPGNFAEFLDFALKEAR